MRGQRHAPVALYTPGKDPVPIVQEAGWAPGPVWTGAENLTPTGIRSPDRPARSQSLYRLRYPAHGLFKSGELSCVILSYTPHPPHNTVFVHQIASEVRENSSQNLPRIKKKKTNKSRPFEWFSKFGSRMPCGRRSASWLFCASALCPTGKAFAWMWQCECSAVCGGSAFGDWALITGLSLCFPTDISHQTPRHSCDFSLFLTLKLLPKNKRKD